MTVDELNKELEKLQKEGYGKLNIAYRDDYTERGLSRVDRIDVVTDNQHISKFVLLNTNGEE